MKIITQRDMIRSVAARWRQQYWTELADDGGWRPPYVGVAHRLSKTGLDNSEIYLKLRALDVEVTTAGDVEAIIGNTSWTEMHCKECEASVTQGLLLQDERSVEHENFLLCPECVRKAFTLWETRS